MLKIRLARVGRKKQPHYRIVVTEKSAPPQSNYIEILGHYHPIFKDEKNKLVCNEEKIKYWLKNGAKLSDTVNNLLVKAGILPKSQLLKITVKPKSKKKKEEKAPKPTSEEIKAAQGETQEKTTETPLEAEKAKETEAEEKKPASADQPTGETEATAGKEEKE